MWAKLFAMLINVITVTKIEKNVTILKMFHAPHPPATSRSNPTPRHKMLTYRTYHPRRSVPNNIDYFGTYYSPQSLYYDLYCIKNYYNWDYKLCPRLKTDRRPIWK